MNLDRCHQNIGRRRRIKADGAAVDFNHALLTAALAEQLQLAAWHQAKMGHACAGVTITGDGADPQTAVAATLCQGMALLRRLPGTTFPPPAPCHQIGEKTTAGFRLLFFHGLTGHWSTGVPRNARGKKELSGSQTPLGDTANLSYTKQ